jgi:glycosyltransferase involved in cell wall biosynthesis
MKISVCMAVYNGTAFLLPQVRSILAQLRQQDELVVVDDASRDASVELLSGISDPRLRLHRNEKNLGVLATFEKGLRLTQGEIIFLSDQDDLWLPGKVEAILAVFIARPEVTLVASDAQVIDETGAVVAASFFAQRGPFRAGVLANLVKNKYLGCTMAFRRSMLDRFLPIPQHVPMHDMWFGMLNAIYGTTYYIDQPLIAYRRHGHNLSPSVGAPFRQKFLWRWSLLKNLLPHLSHFVIGR